MNLYRNFKDQTEIDAMYDVLSAERNAPALLAEHFELSARTQEEHPHHLAVPYGPTLDEYLDIYPAGPGAPVLVFWHGGYWHVPISSGQHAQVARGPLSHGVTTVIVNYSLCPKVTLDEITRQARSATAWVYRNIATYGGDPERIVVSGHSAGGQLVGMLAVTDWEKDYGLPDNVIKAGIPLCGLFDLRPFPYSWLAPKLLLTSEVVHRQSPLFHVKKTDIEMLIPYGGLESEEFHRQSAEYAEAWKAAGNTAEVLEMVGHTHLTAYAELADPTSQLSRMAVNLIGRSTGARGTDGDKGGHP